MPFDAHEYSNAIDRLHDKVDAAIAEWRPEKPERTVFYSAYPLEDDMPIDNLMETAAEGRIEFIMPHDPFWGEGLPYRSAPITNPRWIDVAVLANDMIRTTGDYQHIFLEGIKLVEDRGELYRTYEFLMGS